MSAPRSPVVIAALSALFPGTGHLYAGRRRGALIWMVPAALAVLVLVGWIIGRGPLAAAGSLLLAPVALGATLIALLFGTWHIVSVLAAARLNLGAPRAVLIVHLLLAAVLLVPYGWAASVGWAMYEADQAVFAADLPPGAAVAPSLSVPSDDPEPAVKTPAGTSAPTAQPLPITDDLTVLVIGSDALSARECCGLTDTLMILNYDPDSAQLSMLSLPRDVANFPLSSGAVYTGKINSLLSFAQRNPDFFGGADPYSALLSEVGYLVGIDIDHYLLLDLDGALRLADVLGGVTVDNPKPINDPTYVWLDGHTGFRLPAGTQTLSGEQLLAFARSRKGAGDSDFTRAARQQEVINSLWHELLSPSGLSRLPDILPAVAANVRTDMDPGDAMALLQSLASEGTRGVRRAVLDAPYTYHPSTEQTGGSWELRLNLEQLATLSVDLYGEASGYATD